MKTAEIFDIARPDWAIARVDAGWNVYRPAGPYEREVIFRAALNTEWSGFTLFVTDSEEFRFYGGSRTPPRFGDGKCHQMLLARAKNFSFKGQPVTGVAPVWVDQNLASHPTLYSVSEALAHFVHPTLGSRDRRTVLVREFIEAANKIAATDAKRRMRNVLRALSREDNLPDLSEEDRALANKIMKSARR